MILLQIEHPVPDYKSWKTAFDYDPVNRKISGVVRYRTYGLTGDPNYVIIDLEFENLTDAEALLQKLHQLWQQVEGKVMMNPKTRLMELLDDVSY